MQGSAKATAGYLQRARRPPTSLGIELDSVQIEMRLPAEKLLRVSRLIRMNRDMLADLEWWSSLGSWNGVSLLLPLTLKTPAFLCFSQEEVFIVLPGQPSYPHSNHRRNIITLCSTFGSSRQSHRSNHQGIPISNSIPPDYQRLWGSSGGGNAKASTRIEGHRKLTGPFRRSTETKTTDYTKNPPSAPHCLEQEPEQLGQQLRLLWVPPPRGDDGPSSQVL